MHNSDLVEMLAILREEERQRLLFFLQTSDVVHAHSRTKILLLVEYLLAQIQENLQEPIGKPAAYAYLFPNKPLIANKLEKLMADTLKAIRHFVAEEGARPRTEMQHLFFQQRFYGERNMEDKFRRARKQMEQSKNTHAQWEPQDYYFQFLSESEEYAFQSHRNQKKDDLNLWSTIQALDEYYLVERLWFTCALLNQNQLAPLALPAMPEWQLFDWNSAKFRWFFDKPLGQLFARAIRLLSDESGNDEQGLREFVELLTQYESKIAPLYISAFEVYACNYATRYINKGRFEYQNFIFQIQKNRLASGRVYLDGKIKASEVQNAVAVGLRLGESEWVRQFLEDHRHIMLGSMPSEHYYQYNLAHYLYHIQDYDAALKTLLTTSYEDMQYKISAKILEIKILYETSHLKKADPHGSGVLESKVEAAILFFFREEKIPAAKKAMCKRFAQSVKRILGVSSKDNAHRIEKIRHDILSAEAIAERQWLLKILAERPKE
jgi:hypothetical protein